MALNQSLYSSNNSDWETPGWLFRRLNREFGFTCDVAATVDNTKVYNFIGPDLDALVTEWKGVCWLNPPYGREVGTWMAYAISQAMMGNCEVVCLVPARTDTRWWWDTARHGDVRFLKGRLKFVGAKSSAPFPSAIVIFRRCMELGNGTTRYWEIAKDDSHGE